MSALTPQELIGRCQIAATKRMDKANENATRLIGDAMHKVHSYEIDLALQKSLNHSLFLSAPVTISMWMLAGVIFHTMYSHAPYLLAQVGVIVVLVFILLMGVPGMMVSLLWLFRWGIAKARYKQATAAIERVEALPVVDDSVDIDGASFVDQKPWNLAIAPYPTIEEERAVKVTQEQKPIELNAPVISETAAQKTATHEQEEGLTVMVKEPLENNVKENDNLTEEELSVFFTSEDLPQFEDSFAKEALVDVYGEEFAEQLEEAYEGNKVEAETEEELARNIERETTETDEPVDHLKLGTPTEEEFYDYYAHMYDDDFNLEDFIDEIGEDLKNWPEPTDEGKEAVQEKTELPKPAEFSVDNIPTRAQWRAAHGE